MASCSQCLTFLHLYEDAAAVQYLLISLPL